MSDTDDRSGWEAVAEGPAFYEALGRAIKVERTARGLERKDLAERSGISYPYLSEIENGTKRPSSKALLLIARALEMHPSELMQTAETWTGAVPASPEERPYKPRVMARAFQSEARYSRLSDLKERERLMREIERLMSRLSAADLERLRDWAARLGE